MITHLNSFKLFTTDVICDMISGAGTMLSVLQTDNIAYIVNFVTQYQEVWNKCRGDEQTLNELKYKIILHFTNDIYANPSASFDIYANPSASLHKLYTALAIKNIQNEIMSKNANISQTFGEYIYPIPLADGVCLEMIKVKAGTFMMGSPQNECGRRDDELSHSVTLTKKFWIGKNPVAVEQYNRIAGAAYKGDKEPCKAVATLLGCWMGAAYKGDKEPCKVTWYEAQKFCDILNERYTDFLPSGYMFALPTEAQWECACRASIDTTKIENILKELYDMEERHRRLRAELDYYNRSDMNRFIGTMTRDIFRIETKIKSLAYNAREKIENMYQLFQKDWLKYAEWCRDWYENEYSSDPEFLTRNRGKEKIVRGMGLMRGWRSDDYPKLHDCSRVAKRDKCDPSRNIATFRIAIAPMLEYTV